MSTINTIIHQPTVLHTEEGLKIAETGMSLHPVVYLLKAEWPNHLIQMHFEFTDHQMAAILTYIQQHPEGVETDYIAGRKQVDDERRAWREKFATGKQSENKETWPIWWPDDRTSGSVIHIIEAPSGPMISNSRASVYDVMEVYDEGSLPHEITQIYNLSPYQVKVALQYIEAHRDTLEPELKKIVLRKVERERHYREFDAAFTQWRMETNPPEMTPRKAALKALLEERRRARGEL